MKSAALELGQHNITVNAVIPGLTDTPLTRYDKRLRESMAETGGKPLEHPIVWGTGRPETSLPGLSAGTGCRRAARRRHQCMIAD